MSKTSSPLGRKIPMTLDPAVGQKMMLRDLITNTKYQRALATPPVDAKPIQRPAKVGGRTF